MYIIYGLVLQFALEISAAGYRPKLLGFHADSGGSVAALVNANNKFQVVEAYQHQKFHLQS